MKLLFAFFLASASAFAPSYRPFPKRTLMFESDDAFTKTSSPVNSGQKAFDFNDILESVQNFDISSVTDAFGAIQQNAMEGQFGERGEAYVAAQLGVILCIVGGGIPFVGDFLMLLLGPGLLTVGLGVAFVSIADLGDALSPWPTPANNGLKTEGLYAQVRHPLYAGLLAVCAGLSIITGSATRLLLTALLIYVLDVKSDYEEQELVKVYPEYSGYKKKVTAKFFPQAILDTLPWVNK
jgi:protein-S-isoprenylcysteine O-methyltransferase Ste14